ncbi:jg11003, partial [Pararge aegeria aegeria]
MTKYRRRDLDIIAGTSDGDVYIWDYTTKELINKITVHSSPVTGVCLLCEDRIVTVSDGGDLNVTDLTVLNSLTMLPEDAGGVVNKAFEGLDDGFQTIDLRARREDGTLRS